MAIIQWETNMRKYVEAGGTKPGDEDLRMILLNIMPQQFREALLWRATECRTYGEFREHVRVRAEQMLMLRKRVPAHLVEPTAPAAASANDAARHMQALIAQTQPQGEDVEQESGYENDPMTELMAVMQRRSARGLVP